MKVNIVSTEFPSVFIIDKMKHVYAYAESVVTDLPDDLVHEYDMLMELWDDMQSKLMSEFFNAYKRGKK